MLMSRNLAKVFMGFLISMIVSTAPTKTAHAGLNDTGVIAFFDPASDNIPGALALKVTNPLDSNLGITSGEIVYANLADLSQQSIDTAHTLLKLYVHLYGVTVQTDGQGHKFFILQVPGTSYIEIILHKKYLPPS